MMPPKRRIRNRSDDHPSRHHTSGVRCRPGRRAGKAPGRCNPDEAAPDTARNVQFGVIDGAADTYGMRRISC